MDQANFRPPWGAAPSVQRSGTAQPCL